MRHGRGLAVLFLLLLMVTGGCRSRLDLKRSDTQMNVGVRAAKSELWREALFRSLDNDTDGRISMSEAKVNHQFVDAFARLDRDGNGGIDRQEFERVQLEDDAKSARVAR